MKRAIAFHLLICILVISVINSNAELRPKDLMSNFAGISRDTRMRKALEQQQIPEHRRKELTGRAELSITHVERIGRETLEPGEIVRTRVRINNTGSASANVSVASVGRSATVNRSRNSAIIPAGGNGSIRLDIPVAVEQVSDNRFRTRIWIVAANSNQSASWLEQLWRDRSNDDNVRQVSFPVNISVYNVRAVIKMFEVHDDCDSGSEPGEWDISFSVVSATRTYNFCSSGCPSFRTSSAGARLGRSNRYESELNSGRSYRLNREILLRTVASNQFIAVTIGGREHDNNWAVGSNECTGGAHRWLSPDQWQRGGEFLSNAGTGHFTLHFQIGSSPATLH